MKKQEEFAGYVFLCSDQTEEECLRRSLFGGKNYTNRVKGIEKGKKLFLFNYISKELKGVFEATSNLKENIVPKAWDGEYPQQIKVKRIADYKPLSREDIPRELIKFDRAHRPTARLTPEVCNALETLFKSPKRKKTYKDNRQFLADDGHWVQSKGEQQIDNWLYSHRIVHAYDVPIGSKRCDFKIPSSQEDIYIEYWGMNSSSYVKNKEVKKKLYKEKNLKLISLYPEDLKHLNDKLKKLL